MKTIVTHFAPDVDAVTSVWLLKRFLPGWAKAELAFVPAGQTLDKSMVDSDPDILHVDTGLGRLDHHQADEDTCAAAKTMEFIADQIIPGKPPLKVRGGRGALTKYRKFPDEALTRLIDVVNDIDHFREVYFPNSTADFYDFGFVAILDGLKLIFPEDHQKIAETGLLILDGIYKTFQNKVWAEAEINRNGVEFKTSWGKGIGVETVNDEIVRIGLRQGYKVVVRKDPKKNYVRIKAKPESEINLTSCYNRYRKLDSAATWYLHQSRKMILNGSMKNPDSKPTKLTLREIIEVLKK